MCKTVSSMPWVSDIVFVQCYQYTGSSINCVLISKMYCLHNFQYFSSLVIFVRDEHGMEMMMWLVTNHKYVIHNINSFKSSWNGIKMSFVRV